MSIEEQIAQISNPQDFTRLCNAVLTEKYGSDFQVIDGTRGDGGNDGYIISEKRIIAMYCPVKPEKKTDKDFLTKIKSDLGKAVKLRSTGEYEVERWTFLTPRKLANCVVSIMRREAAEVSIEANSQESTFLANELYKNEKLIKAFSFLHIYDIDAKLDEILESVKARPESVVSSPPDIDKEHVYQPDTADNEEFDRVVGLRNGAASKEKKSALKVLSYKATDPIVQINALLGLLDFFNPMDDSSESMIQLCDSGIKVAERVKGKSVHAYFLAQKGYHLSLYHSDIDMRTCLQIRVDNQVGFPMITEEQRQSVIEQLSELKEGYTKAFSDALGLAKESQDVEALASVFIAIGNAAGHRALYLSQLGYVDIAEKEKQHCKNTLLAVKDMYAHVSDELGVANALFNLANHIRFLGEETEALALTVDSIEVAKKYDDAQLLQKASWLKESLETGKIPDYVHGERRE
ncbi:MAG: hypothetical protein V3V95_00530 [Thermodesulfobacteriota bacterium]